MNKWSVYLNGKLVGFHGNGRKLVESLKEKRRKSQLNAQYNFAYYKKAKVVFINTDAGRVRRPLIVVKNGESRLTQETVAKLAKNEAGWNDLVEKGIIEYLDAEEEENAFIATSEKEIKKENTHVEVDCTGLLGFCSNQLPFPEFNMAPRVLMAAQHIKQSIGLYASNYNVRTDTRAHLLYYPQKPLVHTRVYDIASASKRASGENFVVAVLSYNGWNLNDAIVVSKAAVERGLGRSSFLRTYTAEEGRYPGGQRDKFQVPEEFVQGYQGEEAYANLDENGFTSPETPVNGNDVLIGRTSPPRFLKELTALDIETEQRRESSVAVRGNEAGIVDNVLYTVSQSGNNLVKVKVRDQKVPEIGDKFSSRFGQKGVVAHLEAQEDLPFTRDGITPDLIINPHAIPGRMTAGHLLEMVGGKASSMSGKFIDATAFDGMSQEAIEKLLAESGYRPSGEETLFDGRTGKALSAKIFIGVIYYQRLYHLVSLKMHVRSRGPVQMLTHQPTEGRARQGGLRLGEMERDCFVGFGAAGLLKERMIDSSDKTIQIVCEECGSIGVYNKIKDKEYCPLCGGSSLIKVEMGYAFKLLLDELKSLAIFPKLKLGHYLNNYDEEPEEGEWETPELEEEEEAEEEKPKPARQAEIHPEEEVS